MSDKFRYTYSAPTDGERKEIERIRREYLPDAHGEKMTRLRALHARVRNVPMALAVTLGVAGVLLFGLGMSMVLAWNLLLAGSAVAAVGCVPMALAYPVYNAAVRAMKKKIRRRDPAPLGRAAARRREADGRRKAPADMIRALRGAPAF